MRDGMLLIADFDLILSWWGLVMVEMRRWEGFFLFLLRFFLAYISSSCLIFCWRGGGFTFPLFQPKNNNENENP